MAFITSKTPKCYLSPHKNIRAYLHTHTQTHTLSHMCTYFIQQQHQNWSGILHLLNMPFWASLVAQWLRICLPMQGTRVRALVWEDPTCCRATRPVSHNYWARASGACAPQQERPRQWEARAPRWRVAPTCHNLRKPTHRNEDPTQSKINK